MEDDRDADEDMSQGQAQADARAMVVVAAEIPPVGAPVETGPAVTATASVSGTVGYGKNRIVRSSGSSNSSSLRQVPGG